MIGLKTFFVKINKFRGNEKKRFSNEAKEPIVGKVFSASGSLSFPKKILSQVLKENGATLSEKMNKTVSFVVVKDSEAKKTKKLEKAEELNVKVLSEEELIEMFPQKSREILESCKQEKSFLASRFKSVTPSEASNEEKETFSLLLAQNWDGKQDLSGWWISEKLDGIRAFWNGKHFYSRAGNRFFAPLFFTEKLPSNVCLDGELFLARQSFQETVSIVKNQNDEKEEEKWKKLSFYVFDVPSLHDKVFEERIEFAKQNIQSKFARVVEHEKCSSNSDLEERLRQVEKEGGEGLMARQPNSLYEHKRSKTLLKIKSFQDSEAKVVGYLEGKGKYNKLVGALNVVNKQGISFSIGSGLSDEDRKNPPPVGSYVTYKFQGLTDSSVPRFPVFVCQRIDQQETW